MKLLGAHDVVAQEYAQRAMSADPNGRSLIHSRIWSGFERRSDGNRERGDPCTDTTPAPSFRLVFNTGLKTIRAGNSSGRSSPWRIVISGKHRACNIVRPKRPADVPYVNPLNVADFKGIRAG